MNLFLSKKGLSGCFNLKLRRSLRFDADDDDDDNNIDHGFHNGIGLGIRKGKGNPKAIIGNPALVAPLPIPPPPQPLQLLSVFDLDTATATAPLSQTQIQTPQESLSCRGSPLGFPNRPLPDKVVVAVDVDEGGQVKGVLGLGVNWGTRLTHPVPPKIVVRLLKDNGFDKVKLFEADPGALKALGRSGIEVMLGIPNEFLAPLASSVRVAEDWVAKNVSNYISKFGTKISYVAVGNEPLLKTYKDKFLQTTFPALKNVQAALIKAGLGRQVKVTVPLNADVYQTDTDLPSGGDFRSDIRALMISMVKFLSDSGSALVINIYPFLSLYADPHFPKDYAFFNGNSTPIVDGSISYTNVFDANYDTLISALEKNGFASMPVIIGEVGWPTDGDINANIEYAKRFNQGLFDRIIKGQGTPKRRTPPDIYLFGLIDEDAKSIDPGNFERHWGIFYYDGTIKYALNLGNGRGLVAAKGVKYLAKEWCVMSPEANLLDPNLTNSVNYACTYADCTSLGYGSSCGTLDARSNASYAFNMYYQTLDQRKDACKFNNLSTITKLDPSRGTCRFEIMIDLGTHELPPSRSSSLAVGSNQISLLLALLGLITLITYV